MNRSNPLLIHQFQNLIDKVRELIELEARDCHGSYHSDRAGFVYEVVMLNAAPDLLAVLSGFQAGDVDEIDYAIQELMRIFGPDNVADTVEVLHRYRDMAQAMEESR